MAGYSEPSVLLRNIASTVAEYVDSTWNGVGLGSHLLDRFGRDSLTADAPARWPVSVDASAGAMACFRRRTYRHDNPGVIKRSA